MTEAFESWTVRHFSLSNPAGPDQENVPRLLRSVAQELERLGTVEVQDITFGNEITSEGDWPSITVYFHFASDSD